MRVLRRQLHACTWFALVAMLVLALVPTLSHALAFSQGAPSRWAEVCTPQGMKQVAVDSAATGDEGATPATPTVALEHCPYCSVSGHMAGLPPAAIHVPDPGPAAAYVPPLFLHAPARLFAWCSAQPRAPPVVS